MAVKINYEYETVTIPARAVQALERAGVCDIRLLMALCARPELRNHTDTDLATLAAAIGCTETQVAASVAFWRGVGVLVMDGTHERVSDLLHDRSETKLTGNSEGKADQNAMAPDMLPTKAGTVTKAVGEETTAQRAANNLMEPTAQNTGKRSKPERSDQLPNYTTDQLNDLFEQRSDTKSYIDECQNVWGKMFNTHEINILLGLVDYLGLDWEYVLILLSYCRRMSERRGSAKSMHYVETVAFGFYDEGISDPASLQQKLKQMELMAEMEGQLRALFGMGTRSLSATERHYFSTWLYEYGYGMDIIRRAYEITVDTIGEAKIKYTDRILSTWNSQGLKTLDSINKYVEQGSRDRKKGKGDAGKPAGSSFETDSFFDAALRRNFGDDYEGTDSMNPDDNMGRQAESESGRPL